MKGRRYRLIQKVNRTAAHGRRMMARYWIPGSIQKVAVPEGRRGPWTVERFRSKANRFGCGPSARIFTRLVHADHGIFMSDTPAEMRDHREAARRAHGSCLINGLGLGMILAAVLRKPDVTDVTHVTAFQGDGS